jgi:hypothetical protein
MQRKFDSATLEMALVGYTAELRKIEEKMTAIRKHLHGRVNIATAATVASNGSGRKGRMSAAGKRRIAEAQKKRWRKFHAQQEGKVATSKKTASRRKLSPAAKAKLVANLVKARAAKAAKGAAA